jgi:hypothetical protein
MKLDGLVLPVLRRDGRPVLGCSCGFSGHLCFSLELAAGSQASDGSHVRACYGRSPPGSVCWRTQARRVRRCSRRGATRFQAVGSGTGERLARM